MEIKTPNPSSTLKVQRILGVEVHLDSVPTGYQCFFKLPGVDELHWLGEVAKVSRVDQIMWQAKGSKRFRTVMPQAIEELLVRAELVEGIGW